MTLFEGEYSGTGFSACLPCPPGKKCLNKIEADIVECERGTYNAGGNLDCSNCPAGSYCPYTT